MAWTRASYDALYNWIDASKRERVKAVLLADGLGDVVARLEAAQNLGVWYEITHEAVKAVGHDVVAASAQAAEKELDELTKKTCLRCGHIWWPRSPETPRVCGKCKSPYWDRERKGGRPKLNQEVQS